MAWAAKIRRAGADDLDALTSLFDAYRQFYRQPPDLEGARAFLADRIARSESVIFLAEDECGPFGFTQLYPSFTSSGMARIYILNDLFVRPEVRGRGAATALLRHAAEFGRGEGAVRLDLSTAINNAPAQALYAKLGYARVGGYHYRVLDI